MAPKAYDEETQRGLLARDPDELLIPAEGDYETVFAPLRNISAGEILAIVTLLYVCTVAAFNAGYFAKVPGNFAEFFSLSDLVQTNIPMVEYFFNVASFYFFISVCIGIFSAFSGFDIRNAIREIAEPLVIKYHLNTRAFWIGYVILLFAFDLANGLLNQLGVTKFTFVMLPEIIFQGALLYFFWVGRKFKMIPIKTLVAASLISLFVSSYDAGAAWMKSQIVSPGQVQTIQDKDGLCVERNILRNSSSGLLLYNPSIKQYEFRSKEGFKTIYDGHTAFKN